MPSMYLVDESRIEAQQDSAIRRDPALRDHITIVNAVLDCIAKLLQLYGHSNTDELVALRLAVRCFNSGASSLRLLRCGYYQPSLAMVRDLVETTFLLDLFGSDKAALNSWIKLPQKERERQFSPIEVRKKLDDRDGFKEAKRAAAYKLLSTYASHPSPEGFSIISPENMTQVGPFPDKRRLKACLEEIAKNSAYAASVICTNIPNQTGEIIETKTKYFDALKAWSVKYMGATQQPSNAEES